MAAEPEGPFRLWRQDDNGNRFLVGEFPSRSLAGERLTELQKGRHKQTYWVEELRESPK